MKFTALFTRANRFTDRSCHYLAQRGTAAPANQVALIGPDEDWQKTGRRFEMRSRAPSRAPELPLFVVRPAAI